MACGFAMLKMYAKSCGTKIFSKNLFKKGANIHLEAEFLKENFTQLSHGGTLSSALVLNFLTENKIFTRKSRLSQKCSQKHGNWG